MNVILWCWFALTLFALLVWLSRHFQIGHATRKMAPIHSGMYEQAEGALPSLTMLVAAKDEAHNIETCLRSLLAQTYPGLQIIAINDRSDDATGEIIDRMAATASNLSAVHVDSLPAGWFGKNNAMHQGVRLATGEWLCFTDADCEFQSPRALEIAVRCALDRKADFLSILPRHEANSFWECVIQPACSAIMMVWFNPLKVNDPSTPTAYANGAFMLMSRECYEAIDGHEGVRNALNEDMYLARRAKQAGQRLLVVSNLDLYTVRMYASLAETWTGWTRIFFGCFESVRRLVAGMAVVTVFSLLPWLALLLAAGLSLGGVSLQGPLVWLGGCAAAACVAMLSVMWRFYAVNYVSPIYGLFYPLGAVVGFGALINAMRRVVGQGAIVWRGTRYAGGRVD